MPLASQGAVPGSLRRFLSEMKAVDSGGKWWKAPISASNGLWQTATCRFRHCSTLSTALRHCPVFGWSALGDQAPAERGELRDCL
eukprot:8173470-Alexandrium_andersonii.AAC.1